ncbi:replication protein A 70 kDa DNA-binding subunit [Parasteatoda tepidariorum]|uniref:replication protein A 70 kDa DNA-binding subunit n=1 Tax=Parasteatoda tepidariorum TaxID=114398 RepID=UPI00077F80F6|nr:replication protein A 70 kDa DNA-binding subunit [Parasteatoda tepidariorum]XP_015920047.1 replication protein A 70 kDa DNA-binding subunit [Parasteatoda tepidariorum]XP_042902097.1 replication protein A 70 kDa DNA-binding subunit [Parasteatoda tepidariorum]XP_042902098.1 replication protein A 70 kDa DNA-binding subunit [Parasteatoda tepidariorum]
MAPQLTSGAIDRILQGEDVPNAVLQILGCKKIPGTGNDRYRLLISDGVIGCPFAMLGTQLNHMVTNKELEKFTVVRVDKCVCNQVQPDRKVIILLNLTVLCPSHEVNEKIGNPVNATAANAAQPAPSTGAAATNGSAKPSYAKEPQHNVSETSMVNGTAVHPISSLTPYQNKWTIKVRVTNKTPLRTYSNARGEGKLFSMNLLDESGEIKATAFNDAAGKYYDLIEVGKVYYLSKAQLKTADKRYSSLKNEYELTFNNDTTVMPCEESTSIPSLRFDFVPIAEIEQVEKDTNIDVIGVCKSCTDATTLISKQGKELVKREVKLVDRSNKEVSLTLWGSDAEKFDGTSNPVIAVKGARVSEFNGRTLSVSMSSSMQINPDIKEAHILKGWFEREGANMEVQSISGKGPSGSMGGDWKTFAQTASEQLGMGDKPDYYINKATIVMLRKENCLYMACPSQECNKKVVDMNNGVYRCEKCNREYSEFQWRLLLSLSVADFTENTWVTCFQESAEAILGVSAQELGSFKENDEEKFNEVLTEANFKSYVFKLRTKMETFNEESRLKTTVVTVSPIDPVSYTRKILSDIKKLEQEI